jgi:protein-L-isoaspartate(D-aspartate) O-methyltransferase
MYGWQVPPPRVPTKSSEEWRIEREQKVQWLLAQGLLRSERIRVAMLKVAREDFLPPLYRDYAYWEVPLPLPGVMATMSCPHSYPLFYEPLGLAEGQKFLEIGLGSGYGAALAREIVGQSGVVVSMDIDPVTFAFARHNLERAGYRDIVLVEGDGGIGHPEQAPYDRICLTAACTQIPSPLLEQLKSGGRLIAPVVEHGCQNLTVVEKHADGMSTEVLCEVLYVSLRGKYGTKNE